jgi:hypothetical protein
MILTTKPFKTLLIKKKKLTILYVVWNCLKKSNFNIFFPKFYLNVKNENMILKLIQ